MVEHNYHRPNTVIEAIDLLSQFGENYIIIAGGTDIVPILSKENKNTSKNLVDISNINELKGITLEDNCIKIGALTTFTQLLKNPLIREYANALYEAAYEVGSPQIRNLGTIGGNIINASVAADSIGPLMCLDAEVTLVSSAGSHSMSIEEFYKDGKKTALKNGELLLCIRLSIKQDNSVSTFVKLGKRKSLAIMMLGISLMVHCDKDVCTDSRVVLCAVSPFPKRIHNIEQLLVGQKINQSKILECADALSKEVEKMIPTRKSVDYKRESVKGVAKQAFSNINKMLNER